MTTTQRKALTSMVPVRFHPSELVTALIEQQAKKNSEISPLYNEMTDEQARVHFGPEEPLEASHYKASVKYFHAWRMNMLRKRIGSRLGRASILDVGDTDGLLLKHLGKEGLSFNLSPAVVDHIQSNGIEAQLGDGHDLPFATDSFDYVFCFETLEHVENPVQLLEQLARVCRTDGRIFLSIPWVAKTNIHPRDNSINRGYGHVFEFSRNDFVQLLTHTPLEIRWEAVCDTIGKPETFSQRALIAAHGNSHFIAGLFRRFQVYELGFRA